MMMHPLHYSSAGTRVPMTGPSISDTINAGLSSDTKSHESPRGAHQMITRAFVRRHPRGELIGPTNDVNFAPANTPGS